MERNRIGKRLRIARLTRKPILSQKNLIAKMELKGININRTAISKIEYGQRLVTDIELVAFSEILEVDVKWLLEIEDK